jgi:hypothetical protein
LESVVEVLVKEERHLEDILAALPLQSYFRSGLQPPIYVFLISTPAHREIK